MDWTKAIGKFFFVIAAFIPGSSAVLVAALHYPRGWNSYWSLNYLGYQTKLAILIALAVVAGMAILEILDSLAGAIADFLTYLRLKSICKLPWKGPGESPFRQSDAWYALAGLSGYRLDQVFRAISWALSQGAQGQESSTPNGSGSPRKNSGQLQAAGSPPNPGRKQQKEREEDQEKIEADLGRAFGTAGLILFLAALWTPALYHWWIMSPCLLYVLITIRATFMGYVPDFDSYRSMETWYKDWLTQVSRGEHTNEKQEVGPILRS